MKVNIPEGTLLKPRKPAALSCRTHALGRIFDILGGLLGQGNPDFLCAAGFSDSPHFMYSGYDRNDEWFQLFQIGFGGIPGKPFGDGPDGHSLWPSFTNVPNEFLESYFPLRIEIYETIPDSGGAGLHRGGNGIRVGYRFEEDNKRAVLHFKIDEGQRYRIRSYSVQYVPDGDPLDKDKDFLSPDNMESLAVFAPGYAYRAEDLERGWYAGPVGFVDADGGGEFCVALRSAVLRGDEARLFAGAGIVDGSIPDAELQETRLKLRALLAPLLEI